MMLLPAFVRRLGRLIPGPKPLAWHAMAEAGHHLPVVPGKPERSDTLRDRITGFTGVAIADR